MKAALAGREPPRSPQRHSSGAARPAAFSTGIPPPPSPEGESDTSDTEDYWAKIRRRATRGGDQELAGRLNVRAALVQYNRKGGNPRWEAVPYGQLKELCQAGEKFWVAFPLF